MFHEGMCPKSFDPYTLDERKGRRQIRLTTAHQGGKMYGSIIFDLGGSEIQLKANSNMLTTQQCTEDFKRLKTASEVSCTRETFDAEEGTGSYLITFKKWPLYPAENNIFTHIGNPQLENFFCNTTKIDKEEAKNPTCTIEDTVTEDLPGIVASDSSTVNISKYETGNFKYLSSSLLTISYHFLSHLIITYYPLKYKLIPRFLT